MSESDATTRAHVQEEPRQVSPITPVLNAWKVATALVAFAVWQGQDVVMEEDLPLATVGLIFLAVLIISAVTSLTYNYLAWRRIRYGFDAESIYLHRGILFRSQRHVRLDRIQSVDLNRPILARIFGFVSLQVTSAGSGTDNLVIAFVRDDEAGRLRNEILARAAGLSPGEEQAPAPQAPERELFRITPARIFGSLLRSPGLIIGTVVTAAVVTGAIVMRDPSIIVAMALPILAQGSFWWQRLNQQFDFSVATSPDGIRLRYGLLSTVARTVPPGRVQAVQFAQPVLWRRKNWWRVTITVAGEGINLEGGVPMLYPVATQAEAAHLLSLILPDLGVEEPLALIEHALRGSESQGGFTSSPRRAKWVDPIVWKRTGYRITDTATLIRRGRVSRTTVVVPNARIQSMGINQGPIERALGLVTVGLHITPGPIAPTVPHLGLEQSRDFIRHASHQARAARRSAGPERWMERPDPRIGGHDAGTLDTPGEPPPGILDPDRTPPNNG